MCMHLPPCLRIHYPLIDRHVYEQRCVANKGVGIGRICLCRNEQKRVIFA